MGRWIPLAVVAALLVPPAAEAGERIETTVEKPSGKAPLRYRDEVFDSVKVTNGVRYGTAPDAEGQPAALTLDLYEPRRDRARRRPAVVWVHGGGFRSGNSRNPNLVALAQAFARRGYVAVSINYRLQRNAIFAQHDAQAAVRWLRSRDRRLRIDTRRIAIGGSSAGGATALLVGTRPEDPGTSGNPDERSSVRAVVSISGPLPLHSVIDRRDAPALFFQGTADPTVSYESVFDTARAFARAGVPVVFERLQGAGHVPFGQYRTRFTRHSAYFFYEHLGL